MSKIETTYLVEKINRHQDFPINKLSLGVFEVIDHWICTGEQLPGYIAKGQCLVRELSRLTLERMTWNTLWTCQCGDGSILVTTHKDNTKQFPHSKIYEWRYDANYWELGNVINPY
jgi:hypothetical protein